MSTSSPTKRWRSPWAAPGGAILLAARRLSTDHNDAGPRVQGRPLLPGQALRKRWAVDISLLVRTNPSSQRCAGGETLAEPGDAGAHLALVVLEPDFCVLDRAGTRAALSETDEMDDTQKRTVVRRSTGST